ncbi:PAS domain-containing sensor histidine kinase [Lysobacter sp. LF1]|uniref:histidine kinase n=1 Tax=Lysobacter stagni TaxID=3045172 RepID=A0ABT6XC90_9GAMM|nr:PAS domain-containing sensor histidine kinase [Lysobacter sp. LF1]MDI9237756.1 PAS domain-containing sensor histidine kinase [Lysobacter sp. LF1]
MAIPSEVQSPAIDGQVIKDMLWAFAVRSPEHAVMLLDSDGEVTWTNAGAEIILGAVPGGLIGSPIARFFTRRDAMAGIPDHERLEARHRGTASYDRWLRRLDRSRFWASGVMVYLGEEMPCCSYLKLFRDLTEVKMQLEANRERAIAATESSEAKSAAIALMAHELRNPLSGISLAAALMMQRSEDDPKFEEPVRIITRNVSLAVRLIEDLVQHSRISFGNVSLEYTKMGLGELLEISVDIARHQMDQDERPVRILVPASDIEVQVDRMRMQQVIVNLVTNALRYTPEPGRIWVSGTLEGSDAIVRVSDEGVGISPDHLETLFEMFTLPRLKGSKLGLGLGLALVKQIVELHGGSVQARSEGLDKGSQFVVRFPARGNGAC